MQLISGSMVPSLHVESSFADSAHREHPDRRIVITRIGHRDRSEATRVGQSGFFVSVFLREGPKRVIRWALWSTRSQIASAKVADSAHREHPDRRIVITRIGHRDRSEATRVGQSGFFVSVFLREGPKRVIRWALWSTRSQIASAKVGSPRWSCQRLGSSWLVMMVERVP